jgi:hypothetical protein
MFEQDENVGSGWTYLMSHLTQQHPYVSLHIEIGSGNTVKCGTAPI